jgi:hypothetical protein
MNIHKIIKMNELWMVKVGHPREVFLKTIDFHPFWGKQKSWIVWDYDQEWNSII